MYKRCSKCKETKPISEFHLDRGRKDGHYPRCKSCEQKAHKERYQRDPQKQNSATKRWYQSNADKVKAYHDEWRKSHPDKIAEYGKRARSINSDKWKARNAVNEFIRSGKLPPVKFLICSHCRTRQASHYHHNKGYTKEHWLDVEPVCPKCHKAIDRHSSTHRV